MQHLIIQSRYVASLVDWAKEHPDDADVLRCVRDEVFTLRETLDTLGVPGALASNEQWRAMPHAEHRPIWPSASDLTA